MLPTAASLAAVALTTLTAHSGDVRATVKSGGPDPATLTIVRAGQTAYDGAIPDVCDLDCAIADPGGLRVIDLDADGEPEVVIDAYTNGAHCCTRMGVFYRHPQTGTYGWVVEDWRSTGFALKDLDHDGRPEVVGRDVAFEDLFGAHGDSFSPPSIRHFETDGPDAAKLADVTRRFPAPVRVNAAAARRRFAALRRGDDARPSVAAYVADQYLLGRSRTGLGEIDVQARRGVLGTARQARAYRKRLLAMLAQLGYRHP